MCQPEAFRAVEARLFRCGTYLDGMAMRAVHVGARSCELLVGCKFPPELDTIFPFDLELVYQLCEDPTEPFDPERRGAKLVLYGCSVQYIQPLMIIAVVKSTGQIEIPEPTFILTYTSEEWIEATIP